MLAMEGMVWRVAWSVRVSCGPRLGRSPRPGRHRDHTPLFREPVRQTACLFFPLPVSPPLSVGTALTGQTRFRGPGRLPGIEFRCAAAEERSRSPFLARPPGTGNVRLSSGSSASTTGICHRRRRRRCLARLIPVEYETITTPPRSPGCIDPAGACSCGGSGCFVRSRFCCLSGGLWGQRCCGPAQVCTAG